MIKSVAHIVTLAYQEMAALDDYLLNENRSIEMFFSGASFSASAHGVTVRCASERQSIELWETVLKATDEEA